SLPARSERCARHLDRLSDACPSRYATDTRGRTRPVRTWRGQGSGLGSLRLSIRHLDARLERAHSPKRKLMLVRRIAAHTVALAYDPGLWGACPPGADSPSLPDIPVSALLK